jgi:hypothetical protein
MHRLTIIFLLCAILSVAMSVSEPKPRCDTAPRCRMVCRYGFQLDSEGCATCRCKKTPCTHGRQPLKGYFCGKGATRRDCPTTHECVIAPNDSYAVCCRNVLRAKM